MERARERLDERRHLRREARWNGMEVDARNPFRDDEQLPIGAVQQRQQVVAEGCAATGALRARSTRSGVRSDDTLSGCDVDAGELVSERRRRLGEQQRVAAAERLQVGAVGERDLDLHEDVARAGLRVGHLLDAQVARRVEPRRPHGRKTTFSASRRRNRSSPSANRASGSTVGSGTSSSGRSAAASSIAPGVAERAPTTVSSRR